MNIPKIPEGEYRFCLIMWEHEPVSSLELVKLCQEKLAWKRTTTYTVIKRLGERGVLKLEAIIKFLQLVLQQKKLNILKLQKIMLYF